MKEQTFLTVRQIADRYSVSVPTIWRWSRENRLPAPFRLGPASTRWRLSEIEAWEKKRGDSV